MVLLYLYYSVDGHTPANRRLNDLGYCKWTDYSLARSAAPASHSSCASYFLQSPCAMENRLNVILIRFRQFVAFCYLKEKSTHFRTPF